MILAVVVLLGAALLGRLLGGSLARLGERSLRSTRLASAAVVAQIVGGLVALGLLANALVVSLNGAMPVAGSAAGRAGVSTQDLLTGADPRHVLIGDRTRLRALSDVLPAPWPVVPEVLSPGDVMIAAGLGQLVLLGMLGAGGVPREPRPAL